jgi:hypothetical protein
MLTQWVPQEAIRSFGVRFTAITQIGERMVCTGKVVEKAGAGWGKMCSSRVDLCQRAG